MTIQKEVLNTAEVQEFFGVSHSHLYACLLNDPDFPRPFKMGIRKNAWRRTDLQAWLDRKVGKTVH